MTFVVLNHSALRKGHHELLNGPKGFQQFEQWLASDGKTGKQAISSAQPTRIGKGEQMRSGAVCAVLGWVDADGNHHDPIASLVILASPSDHLASQVVKVDKLKGSFKRFGMDPRLMAECKVQRVTTKTDNKSYEALDDHGRIKIISVTNDMMLSRYDHFTSLCRKRLQETGLPVLIWFDECQRLGDDTKMHARAELFMSDANALAITMTATPIRRDGGKILGFSRSTQVVSEKEIERIIGPNRDDPALNDVELLSNAEYWETQQADIEVSWSYAWENECLCQVNVEKIKVEAAVLLEQISDDEHDILAAAMDAAQQNNSAKQLKLLSDFYDPSKEGGVTNEALVRRIINMAVRDERVIREACRAGIKKLKARRKLLPKTKMVIFGGNDRPDSSDNEHLEQIKRIMASEWNRYFPGQAFRPMVLTMKSQQGADSSVTERLDEFENGDYDVVLLKQMASEGWDTQCTKVGINLSPVRTYGFKIQSAMRVATPWEYDPQQLRMTPSGGVAGDGVINEKMLTADWVDIWDPYLIVFMKWLKSEMPKQRRVETTRIDEYTKERKDGPKVDTTVTIEEVESAGTTQFGEGGDIDREASEIVLAIKTHYPEMQRMPDSVIWSMYQRGAFQDCSPGAEPPPVDDSAFEDQGKLVAEVISQVQLLIKGHVRAATRRLGAVKLNGSYGPVMSSLSSRMADAHNQNHPRDEVPAQFSRITNLDVARRFMATAASSRWEDVAVELVRRVVDGQEVRA
jgi:superfamily II DNA or RNA helicase